MACFHSSGQETPTTRCLSVYFQNGMEVAAAECVQNSQLSYRVYIPTILLISKLKEQVSNVGEDDVDTISQLIAAKSFASAGSLSTNRTMRHAYVALQDIALANNVQRRLDGETLEDYIIRRGARDIVSFNTTKEKQRDAILRTIDTILVELQDSAPAVVEQDIHNQLLETAKNGKSGKKRKSKKQISDDDPYDNLTFKRLATRQLGDFIQVDVNFHHGDFHLVLCSCEKFKHTGHCRHSAMYELVHGQFPQSQVILFGENWEVAQRKVISILSDNSFINGPLAPPNRKLLVDPIKK
jgi:hypothetical protein